MRWLPVKEPREWLGILYGVAVTTIVEIYPNRHSPTRSDTIGPDQQLRVAIVVAVPSCGSVKTHVDIIGGPDQFIRQSWPAAGQKIVPAALNAS